MKKAQNGFMSLGLLTLAGVVTIIFYIIKT